ncbi:hypothetical protein D1872_245130 [compost metagenome]
MQRLDFFVKERAHKLFLLLHLGFQGGSVPELESGLGGRLVDSRVRISQDILDIAERIHFCESPARVRHERNSAQRKPRPFPHRLGACRDRLPIDMPWKPPMNANIPVLFFALRASLRAASTAFVPVGPQT